MATFVVTGGQLAALDRASTTAVSSIRVTDQFSVSYEEIYKTQPHVRTVIGFLARNIAQLGIHVFKRAGDTDRQRLANHPLANLLARPNTRTTRYRLVDALVNDLGIFDNAFWLKAQVDRQPHGLVRLPPKMVTPLGESFLWAEGYRVKGGRGYRDFPAEQIVHFRGYNPTDSRWGLSPMETLRQVLAEEYEAGRWREQLWRNGARFPGHIRRPAEAKWTEEQRQRFTNSWRGLYTGDGPGAGGTPVLEDGMTFEPSGITPQQAQYLETRKLTREEVAAAFHIPLPMVGILDHATFSNIEEQHKQLYQDTLGPWLEMISEEIELQLLPDIDASPGIYVEFNMAEKLKGDFATESASLQGAVGGPFMTANEGRARMNLPQVDGGDELMRPLNMGIVGEDPPEPAPAAAPPDPAADDIPPAEDPPTEPPKSAEIARLAATFTKRQARVLSAKGAFDPRRWADELATDVRKLLEAQ